MAIEGASLYAQGNPADASAAATRGGSGARGGRIQVELGNQQAGAAVSREQARAFDDQATRPREAAGPRPSYGSQLSSSRLLQWGLLTVVLVAAAFYAGLRWSDFFAGPSSGDASDPLTAGRGEFDRGNYQAALASFSELLRDEPANVRARYWLARAQLETGEYALAAQNFDEVIRAQPSLYDGYIQAAAAYEAMGDRAKAAERMAEYGKARGVAANSNSSPR
jgi:tetratricopeptide (TPR) repeat protein